MKSNSAMWAGMILTFVFFFFSSRRRHTRCLSDWSSDVCSSDLQLDRIAQQLIEPLDCLLGVGRGIVAPLAGNRDAPQIPETSRFGGAALTQGQKIGRASCRERVRSRVVGG